jgi:hypothetical protein
MDEKQQALAGEPQIHAREFGGHWVAWVGDADGRTRAGWTVVGETEAEAIARARARLSRPAPVGDVTPGS